MLGFNSNVLEAVCFLLTVYISIDMAESVREALNLKELLMSLEENNAEFRKLQKHMEVLSAFYGTEIRERSEVGLKKLNAVVEAGKEKVCACRRRQETDGIQSEEQRIQQNEWSVTA